MDRGKIMRPTTIFCGLIAGLVFAGAAGAGPVSVRWESEGAGLQNTSATFTAGGQVETFDEQATGTDRTFSASFGAGYSGTYTGAQINPADQWGGSLGAGNYAVALGAGATYTLDLSASTLPVTYFGYWLSALDGGNQVQFYGTENGVQNQLLFTFTPQNVVASINARIDSLPPAEQDAAKADYYGNPNASFTGQDGAEPFVFIDFFANPGTTFSKIVFTEVPPFGGGYESDNHTVGEWKTQGTGTAVPVPEPATWTLAILGFAFIGGTLRLRGRVARTA